MFQKQSVLALFACALALNATPTSVILSDIGTPVDDWGYVVRQAPLGQSFSTGPTAYNLTSVVLILSNQVNEDLAKPFAANHSKRRVASARSSTPGTKVPWKPAPAPVTPTCSGPCTSVSLWSDNGGPGPAVELAVSTTVVLDTDLPDANSPQQFTFQFSSYALSANTRYWIMVSSPGGNSVAEWWGTDEPTGAVTSEYYDFNTGIFPVIDPAMFNYAQQIQVNGTATTAPPATPVPPSLPLVLTGLLCIGMYITFRKKFGLSS